MNYDDEFTFPSGDIILQSSDGVFYRAHKIVLRIASPVFADMFTIPLPEATDSDENDVSAVEDTVQFTEPSFVMRFVLRSLYIHTQLPTVETFAEAHVIADVADKYDIRRVKDTLRLAVAFKDSFSNQNLRLYRLALKCEWFDVVAATSEATLAACLFKGVDYVRSGGTDVNALRDHVEQLSELSGPDLWKLVQLHVTRRECLLRVIILEDVTKFRRPRDSELSEWLCDDCLENGKLHVRVLKQGLDLLRLSIGRYLDDNPLGTALFQVTPRTRLHQELLPGCMVTEMIMKSYTCPSCSKPFFDVFKITRHFKGLEVTFPKTVFNIQ